MSIDFSSNFTIAGFPVTWDQISNYWAAMIANNGAKAERIGDPYNNQAACEVIAKEMYAECIRLKGTNKITMWDWHNFVKQYNSITRPPETNLENMEQFEINWRNQSEVFRKAVEAAERKHAQERSKRNQQSNKKQSQKPVYTPPPVVIDWRTVLQLPKEIALTEDIIKRAFRKQALICHPDKGGSEEKMKELLNARDLAYYSIGLTPP